MKKSKKTKNALRKSQIISKIFLIENNQIKNAPLIINWTEEVLLSKRVNLLNKLARDIFDICSSQENIKKSFHCIKILLTINEEETIKHLQNIPDFPIRLISYIKETGKNELVEDVFYIFNSFIKNTPISNYVYDFSQSFIQSLFDVINLINEEDNFKAVVSILVEISNIYSEAAQNIILKIFHIHQNSRIFIEVLIRMINEESSKEKLIKMMLCLSNIYEKEKKNVLYLSDMETYIDIVLSKLTSLYTQEVKIFIIDSFEKFCLYSDEYYIKGYKSDEIIELFEDFQSNDTESKVIRKKSSNILSILKEKLKEQDSENFTCR